MVSSFSLATQIYLIKMPNGIEKGQIQPPGILEALFACSFACRRSGWRNESKDVAPRKGNKRYPHRPTD
jgi:hypothetical protein